MVFNWRRQGLEVLSILAAWLDLPASEIQLALDFAEQRKYSAIAGPKGRKLEVPQGALYAAQSLISQKLSRTLPLASAAHGGVPERDIRSHARSHLPAARELLTMDLAAAYQSLPESAVSAAWRNVLRPWGSEMGLSAELRGAIADALTNLVTLDGHLPTGAPSSALVFNLAAAPLDKALERLTLSLVGDHGRYSRYLDDLAFSTETSFPKDFSKQVERAVKVHNLGRVQREKTHLMRRDQGHELVICGLSHDGQGLVLSRSRFERLRAKAQQARRAGHRKRLEGILNFAREIYGPRLPRELSRLGENA